MEHAKGEISITDTNEHGDYYIGNKDSHSYIAIVVADVLSAEDIAKANAQELVRRWNAFEKDGLVDELVVACKIGLDSMQGLLKIADKLKASNKDKKEHNEHIRFVESAIVFAEAAIAKVNA